MFRRLGGARRRLARLGLAVAGTQVVTRVVEVKVAEYADNLMKVVARHAGAKSARTECRRRFKNLPERDWPAVAALIHRHFDGVLGKATP